MQQKKGFTLFELVLVISLVGLFFIFIVPNILRKQTIQKETNITDLKVFISNYYTKSYVKNDVLFECGSDFKSCSIKDVNGSVMEEGISLVVPDSSRLVAYDFDMNKKEYEINFDGIKNNLTQKSIFFRMKFYKNGSSDSFVVYDGKSYLVFDVFSKIVQKRDSLDDAQKVFAKYDKMPINDSKYFFNE